MMLHMSISAAHLHIINITAFLRKKSNALFRSVIWCRDVKKNF